MNKDYVIGFLIGCLFVVFCLASREGMREVHAQEGASAGLSYHGAPINSIECQGPSEKKPGLSCFSNSHGMLWFVYEEPTGKSNGK